MLLKKKCIASPQQTRPEFKFTFIWTFTYPLFLVLLPFICFANRVFYYFYNVSSKHLNIQEAVNFFDNLEEAYISDEFNSSEEDNALLLNEDILFLLLRYVLFEIFLNELLIARIEMYN